MFLFILFQSCDGSNAARNKIIVFSVTQVLDFLFQRAL